MKATKLIVVLVFLFTLVYSVSAEECTHNFTETTCVVVYNTTFTAGDYNNLYVVLNENVSAIVGNSTFSDSTFVLNNGAWITGREWGFDIPLEYTKQGVYLDNVTFEVEGGYTFDEFTLIAYFYGDYIINNSGNNEISLIVQKGIYDWITFPSFYGYANVITEGENANIKFRDHWIYVNSISVPSYDFGNMMFNITGDTRNSYENYTIYKNGEVAEIFTDFDWFSFSQGEFLEISVSSFSNWSLSLEETCFVNWTCSGYASCDIEDEQKCNSVFDNSGCGVPYTGNYSEFTPLVCDFCTPDWECNGYDVCNIEDEEVCNSVNDLNNCSEGYTGNYSEFTPLVCDYCTPDWSCIGYGVCQPDDKRYCNSLLDENACSEGYTGNYSEFTPLVCDYCTPDWVCSSYGECLPNKLKSCNGVGDLNYCGEEYIGDYSEYPDVDCFFTLCNENSNLELCSLLSETGGGIGEFTEQSRQPLGKFILFLAIIGAIVGLVFSITYVIKKALERGR